MELYNNQLLNYKFDITTKKSHHKPKEGEEYKSKSLCNDIFTFDIECTSAFLENDRVISYRKGETSDYWNSLQSLALCYIWQFSCNGTVYYGREIDTFINILEVLPKEARVIIWIHNLSYEFMTLSNILTWSNIFARSPHKPMKCVSNEYPNIEFRCTYMLTRLSLDTWGKQLGVHKMTGDLDYDLIRTPLTELTAEELKYCEMDCLVVEAGIKDFLKKYKTLDKIPLTQTGIVRKEVKDLLLKDKYYHRYVKKLVPEDANEYKRLQDVFAGGYTHANQKYAGKVIDEYIEHYDFASSYPTVMVAEKYPCTPWAYTGDNEIPPDWKFRDNAYIMILEFRNIKSISYNTYIQASKVSGHGFTFDNGRILTAEELHITITEQDWITIRNNYQWEDLIVHRVYKSCKSYLPRDFVDYILTLYENKTILKTAAGPETEEEQKSREDIYLQSKQYINSLYGMSVTSLIQADVVLQDDNWYIKPLTAVDVNERLEKLRNYSLGERRYFLSYSWGCWVTAYARRNLWKCIERYDNDVLYCDTDSIFIRGKADFDWYNNEITEKIKKACIQQGLDFGKTQPRDRKGIIHPLGIFSREEDCTEFISLGAKKYCERRSSDGQLHLTVSGINKAAVKLLDDDIYNFADGFDFDKDSEYVTKKLCCYLTDMPEVVYPDGYKSHQRYGINLRRTGYKLSLTDEYKNLIKYLDYDLSEIPDTMLNHLRGRF